MNERYTAIAFAAIVLLSSLGFALPGAGAPGQGSLNPISPPHSWQNAPTMVGGTASAGQDTGSTASDRSASVTTFSSIRTLHDAGVAGEGVKIGIIGGRFATDHRSLSGSVAANQQFGGREPLFEDGRHGTAVAEVVTRTAPRSELYLAGVGHDSSPDRYAAAVEWLLEQDVDVVVDAGSYFPADAEGMDRLNAVATEAADNGVVFVTSAGNYADRHWRGTAHGDGWLSFGPDTSYNDLGNGTIAGDSSLRLYWEGAADFDLFLYRADAGEDTLVAKSAASQSGNGSHSEAIDVSLPGGDYYVAVRGGESANGTAVSLFSAHHELAATSDTGGMVAPATAENVIAVGAIDTLSGEARPYSSSGRALDILAPDGTRTNAAGEFYGSSAAAPLVAGTVALMVSQNESLTPTATQHVLEQTAVRTDGRLYLDTPRAVDAVSRWALPEPSGPTWATPGTRGASPDRVRARASGNWTASADEGSGTGTDATVSRNRSAVE